MASSAALTGRPSTPYLEALRTSWQRVRSRSMTIRPIIKAPDPRLKVISKPIVVVDDGVRELMDDMLDSMYAANGIGLAAPQIGDPRRVIVLDISRDGEKRIKHQLANPEIIWKSDDLYTYEQGCLSLQEQYADVSRPARVRISFLDYNNDFREIQAEGMLAVCIQHEVDHLDGVLFVDHISALKRNIILRRLIKAKRLEEAGVA